MINNTRTLTAAAKGDSRKAANFGITLLALAFVTGLAPYAYSVLKQGGRGFQTGDWLINYEGGFVRRGVAGQIILKIFPNGEIGLWALLLIQSALYLLVFMYFAYMLLRSNSSWLLTVLVCSPAGICFSGWDDGGFGRKESLGYCVLILLSVQVTFRKSMLLSRTLQISAILVYFFGVLSWEPLALLLPFILYLIKIGFYSLQSFKERIFIQTMFIVTSVFGLLVSILFKGSVQEAKEICEALHSKGYNGLEICAGAIRALGWSSGYTIRLVQDSYPLYFMYLPLFVLALAPIFLSRVLVGIEKVAFGGFVALLPLFFIVTDYGRWFSMYYVSLLLVLIASNRVLEVKNIAILSPRLAIIFLVAWAIPHWADLFSAFQFKGAIATPVSILLNYSLPFKIVYGGLLALIIAVYVFVSFHKKTGMNESS